MTIVHIDRSSRAVQLAGRSFHASYCFESTVGRLFTKFSRYLDGNTFPKFKE